MVMPPLYATKIANPYKVCELQTGFNAAKLTDNQIGKCTLHSPFNGGNVRFRMKLINQLSKSINFLNRVLCLFSNQSGNSG
jgi:hypothetical protein